MLVHNKIAVAKSADSITKKNNSEGRIGFFLKGYPRLSETFISQEIAMLEELGFDLEIFSLRRAREKERHPIVEKIKAPVTYIPEYWKDAPLSILWRNIRLFLRMPVQYGKFFWAALGNSIRSGTKSALKRFFQAAWLIETKKLGTQDSPIKHLHTHFLHAPTELGRWVALLTGLKYSISAHAKDIYTSNDWEIAERIRDAEFLMTCTEHNVDYLQRLKGLSIEDQKKIHKVYHGISTELFAPGEMQYSMSDSRFRLLTCARLVEKKGFPIIFAAIAILKAKGYPVNYEIFGSGELLDSLKSQAAALGIDSSIHFFGNITQKSLIEVYKEKGIFVLACQETEDGDRDGIPNSLAEAMSMELPVVATNISGIPELVENGRSGLLVPPKNSQALAEAIEKIFINPLYGDELGKAARARVQEVFDAKNCIHRCKGLLENHTGRYAL